MATHNAIKNHVFFLLITVFFFQGSQAKCRELSSISGESPFRGRHLSMNKRSSFLVHEGTLYSKPRKSNASWRELDVLPEMKGQIKEIALDGSRMAARGKDNRIFLLTEADKKPTSFEWTAKWGVPFGHGSGLWLPPDTLLWDFSFLSPKLDKSYTDSVGQDHIIGVGVTSLYAVRGDRQTINYFDTWLPSDNSYQVCGPLRGRLRIKALSAAGSSMAVMDRYGTLFVRRHDFDIVGGNSMEDHPGLLWIIGYTYETNKPRDNFFHWFRSPRKLPVPDWQQLPKIDGLITDRISIKKVGRGAKVRFIRVEGEKGGETGYFEARFDFIKASPHRADSFDPIEWKFVSTGQPLEGRPLMSSIDSSKMDLGPSHDQQYRSTQKNKKYFARLELVDFNTHCSPGILRVFFADSAEFMDITLHTREKIRVSRRHNFYQDEPLLQAGMFELPKNLLEKFDELPKAQQEFIKHYFSKDRFKKVRVSVFEEKIELDFGHLLKRHHWQLVKRKSYGPGRTP